MKKFILFGVVLLVFAAESADAARGRRAQRRGKRNSTTQRANRTPSNSSNMPQQRSVPVAPPSAAVTTSPATWVSNAAPSVEWSQTAVPSGVVQSSQATVAATSSVVPPAPAPAPASTPAELAPTAALALPATALTEPKPNLQLNPASNDLDSVPDVDVSVLATDEATATSAEATDIFEAASADEVAASQPVASDPVVSQPLVSQPVYNEVIVDSQVAPASAVVSPVVNNPVVYAAPAYVPATTYHQPVMQQQPMVMQTTYQQPVAARANFNSALAELNALRAKRGLYAFIEDPALTAVAYRKASIQANGNFMGHPGGSMGSAKFEGVGRGRQFITCYQYDASTRYAGAATVVGRNGQRFHCLLVR